MAQGKEWTKEEKEEIIQSLRPYLEMGFSRNRACSFIGLAPSTLSNWCKESASLGMKIVSYENVINAMVMKNLKQSIESESDEKDTKKENSKWWAERKMKDEFSTRSELTAKDGGPISLLGGLSNHYDNSNYSDKEITETQETN